MKAPLDKALVWVRPDQSIAVTYLFEGGLKKHGSLDEFCKQEEAKLRREHEQYKDLPCHVVNLSDLPDATHKRRWRWKADKVHVDMSVKTDVEVREEKRTTVKDKLKSLGLSDEEVNEIVR